MHAPHIPLLSEGKEECSTEDCDNPPAPIPSKKVMPKRKRTLSRNLYSKDNTKRSKPPPPNTAAATSAPADASASAPDSASTSVGPQGFDHLVLTQGASRYVNNSVLKNNLKSVQNQLVAANLSLEQKEKQLESLLKKNQDLSATVRSNRQSTRQRQAESSAEVKQAQSEVKKLQVMLDEKETAMLDMKQSLEAAVNEKEIALLDMKQSYEQKLYAASSDAVEKEKV